MQLWVNFFLCNSAYFHEGVSVDLGDMLEDLLWQCMELSELWCYWSDDLIRTDKRHFIDCCHKFVACGPSLFSWRLESDNNSVWFQDCTENWWILILNGSKTGMHWVIIFHCMFRSSYSNKRPNFHSPVIAVIGNQSKIYLAHVWEICLKSHLWMGKFSFSSGGHGTGSCA